jgi:predicted O-linked N-acetylglucosamine transferase (SPINDLY family)
VTLPHRGCCYPALALTPAPIEPTALGIDPDVPVLLCAGMPFKYAPEHDGVFPSIARRLGSCQLVFFQLSPQDLTDALRSRLREAFLRAGMECERYVKFVPEQSPPAFRGLMRRADVFLDTIGFSGFNTAMHAVETDLPIVTREGRFLRGRLASGILKRMGLHELVAASEEDYVELAVKLARGAGYRQDARARMAASRSILYEDLAPIRALENFLLKATVSMYG